MSKKSRRKAATEAGQAPSAPIEALKRRRNRRLIFVGLVALSFPILEAIAYRFRAIEMTVENRSNRPITAIKLTYAGGSFDAPDLKPGGSITRVTRPDFTFNTAQFSTYPLSIEFYAANGDRFRQVGRAGALDYSAHESYIVELAPPEGPFQLKHQTYPGFPLNAIRGLMARLGFG